MPKNERLWLFVMAGSNIKHRRSRIIFTESSTSDGFDDLLERIKNECSVSILIDFSNIVAYFVNFVCNKVTGFAYSETHKVEISFLVT